MNSKKDISELLEIRFEITKRIDKGINDLKIAKTPEDKLNTVIAIINVMAYCIKEIAIKIDSDFDSLCILNKKVNSILQRLDKLEEIKN